MAHTLKQLWVRGWGSGVGADAEVALGWGLGVGGGRRH